MYYVIAATAPGEATKEDQILRTIQQGTPLLQEQPRANFTPSTIHRYDLDLRQFKIGSLDQLMQLNEQAARLDGQLDVVTKRIEKVQNETRGEEEEFDLNFKARGSDSIPYSQYIRNFKWDNMKYQTKRSLQELTTTIQLKMGKNDDQIRKNLDEYNNIKTKIAALKKKETGNLTQRDFTDDIYNKGVPAEIFVESHQSEMFSNLLIVLNNEKVDAFANNMTEIMENYYKAVDEQERKKVRDQALNKFKSIMNAHQKYEDAKAAIDEENKGAPAQNADQIEEESKQKLSKFESDEATYVAMLDCKKNVNVDELEQKEKDMVENDKDFLLYLQCLDFLCKEGYDAIKEVQGKRIPFGMAPRLKAIGIDDRENNQVFHTVVYKPQLEDAIKACRKVGVLAKAFVFDRDAWDEEKKELINLQDNFENRRINLHQVSTDLYQDSMMALMHIKVIRAFIEGILRFGIERPQIIGLVCPRKGMERQILHQMNACLAEGHLKEMYGEKMDAQEQDDYWPFVCIPLTSPIHVFDQAQ